MPPALVADAAARVRRWWLARVAVEPASDVVGVDLLAPHQPGAGLAEHPHLLGCRSLRRQVGVELVGVGLTSRDDRVEGLCGPAGPGGRRRVRPVQPQAQLGGASGGDRDPVTQCGLRAETARVDRCGTADDVVVDAVLRVRRARRRAEDPRSVGLVLAEQGLGGTAVGAGRGIQPVPGERVVGHEQRRAVTCDARSGRALLPRPRVAEPQRGQHVDRRLVRAVVLDDDPHQHLGGRRLGVGDVDRPVPVVVEDAGVEQLELGVLQPPAVPGQGSVGELGLRVVVAPVQQGVARQPLEVPPVLLGVLAVVALRAGQAEHPLLEDRVRAVPQGQPEAELVADVRDGGHPVLVPPVRTRPRVVVGERPPGVPVGGVVLPHGAPGALAEVRPPLVPGVRGEHVGLGAAGRLGQPRVLRGGWRRWGVVHWCHCTRRGTGAHHPVRVMPEPGRPAKTAGQAPPTCGRKAPTWTLAPQAHPDRGHGSSRPPGSPCCC